MGVIALDVYGTLIDTAGVATHLDKRFGTRAHAAAQLWREKQLEYTFRRALMRRYADFDACTAQALRYVLVPHALRIVLPPLTSEFLSIVKNSSLALTIGVLELTAQSRQIENFTFHGFEAFGAATAFYVAVALVLNGVMAGLQRASAMPTG